MWLCGYTWGLVGACEISSTISPTAFFLRAHRDICLRKDSHEFVVVVDHGQAANLIRRHEPQCIGEIIVCTHRDGIMSRDFAYRHALGVLTRRDRANDDVTVCDDAGQLVAIENSKYQRPRWP